MRLAETKFVEIRDSATFIPAMAVRFRDDGSDEAYVLRRSGWRDPAHGTLLVKMGGTYARSSFDPYGWRGCGRTMQVAHEWLEKHWDEVESGDVVDVEFVLGITEKPRASERLTIP